MKTHSLLLCFVWALVGCVAATAASSRHTPPPIHKVQPSGRITAPDPVTNHVTRTVYYYTNAPATTATTPTNTYTYKQTNWVATHPPIPLTSAPGAQMSQPPNTPDPSGNITLVQADPTLVYTQQGADPTYANDQTGGAAAPYYAYSQPEYSYYGSLPQPSTGAIVVNKLFNLGRPVTRGGYFEIRGQRTTFLGFEGDWRSGADATYGFGRYDAEYYTVGGGYPGYYGGSAPVYHYSGGRDYGGGGSAPGYQQSGGGHSGGGTAPSYD